LAFDGSGNPYIDYVERDDTAGDYVADLKLASWDGVSAWNIETVDGDGTGLQYMGEGGSIAFDSSGNLHIIYGQSVDVFTKLQLKYSGPIFSGISLDGMRLPGSSWGVANYYGNGMVDVLCGNYNGNVPSFNGIISDCELSVSNGMLEICKNCWQSPPTKWGWTFNNVNLAQGFSNDLSSSILEIGNIVGMNTAAWSDVNGMGDRLYGNAIGSGTIDLTLKTDGTNLFKCDNSGLNCVDVTSSSTKLDSYLWERPASGAFSGYEAGPAPSSAVPEFGTVALVLALALVAGGFIAIRTRK
jgi:hypothetical protein